MKRMANRCACLLLLLTCLCAAASQIRLWPTRASAAPLRPADETTRARVHAAYGQLPLSFETNRGQADRAVRFLARGGNYHLSLMSSAATLEVREGAKPPLTVRMELVGAHPAPQLEGRNELPGKSHYLIGADPQRWQRDIPNYAAVRYRGVYPGVDLLYYGNQRQLEYDFIVAPGADPRAIKLSFDGAQSISVDASGDLILRLAGGELRQSKPVIYQTVNGERRIIKGRYVVRGKQVGFALGRYDRNRALVIDPVLHYTARLMPGDRIAVDGQGSAYIIAEARREVFPSVKGEKDILVVKLNPAGTQVVYNTIVGGSLTDTPVDIVVDAEGNITLLVNSSSPDLPGLIKDFDQGAIQKSTDGAENFQPSGRNIFGWRVASEFVFDPTQPGVIYVSAFGLSKVDLFYKSTDSGGSWQPIGQALRQPVPLLVVPSNPSVLYVAALGGLMSSADGGITWNAAGLGGTEINSLSYDPRHPATLYAATRQGLFKSTDGGRNWTVLRNGLPDSTPLKLVVDPSNPDSLYVWISRGGSENHQIYRSSNGGASWSFAAEPPNQSFPEWYITALAIDPRNSTLYFGTYRGLFKIAGDGQTVRLVGLADFLIESIAIDPTNSATIYVSTPRICCVGLSTQPFGGIQKTTDGGANWTRVNNSLKDQPVSAIGIDPFMPATVLAATTLSGLASSGAFALRLSADGARPVFSILAAFGVGTALARDGADNLYVTGSGQLPTLRNALPTTQGPGFVTKLNGRTREVDYATYLAGQPKDLAVDRLGMIAIAGDSTGTQADALLKNGFQLAPKGGQEAFVCRLNPQLAGAEALLFGSYLSSEGEDTVKAVAVDANGMIYVTGRTVSVDFPTTPATQIAGIGPDFLVKIDPTKTGLASLLWGTRLGTATVANLVVDATGNVYLTGTSSGNLFVTPGALQGQLAPGNCSITACRCPLVMGFCPAACGYATVPLACSDAFVAKISADGAAVLYATYFGSAADQTAEGANDIALDPAGNVYLTGYGKLPVTTGALQLEGWNGFLAKLTLDARSTAVTSVSAASFAGPQLAPESLAVAFLDASGAGANNLRVQVRDSSGAEAYPPVLYSGPGQVNFQLPTGLAMGAAMVRVLSGGGVIASGAIEIVPVAPGVFAANANGRGVAAAVAQRVKPDNTQSYEPVARYDQTQSRFVAVPIDLESETDQIFLVLFGTGWRYRSAESAVKVTVGGVDVPVTYAGLQPTLAGVDQINARLPRSLRGRGEVDIVVMVDGKTANTIKVNIK